MNKRAINVSASSGGVQNSGVIREAATTSVGTPLPQSMTTAGGKGAVAVQDKAGKYSLCIVCGVTTWHPTPMYINSAFFKNRELKFTCVCR